MESWFIHRIRSRRKLAWVSIPVVVSWSIWKKRNARIFEGQSLDIGDLFQKVKWRLCVWLCSNKDFKDFKAEDFCQSWGGLLVGRFTAQKD